LLAVWVAMRFSGEVDWGAADFAIAAFALYGAGIAYTFLSRRSGDWAYRFAAGLAVICGLLLFWVNAAVGVIGNEDNPANWVYLGILAVGAVGALITRCQPRGMARTLFGMAFALIGLTVIAVAAGFGPADLAGSLGVVAFATFFAAIFAASGLLFREAALMDPA